MAIVQNIRKIVENHKYLVKKIYGLPSDPENDDDIKKMLVTLERFAYCLFITRRGQNQPIHEPLKLKFTFFNIFVRLLTTFHAIRLLLLAFIDDPILSLYAGDPLGNAPGKSSLLVFLTMTGVFCALLREYILYLEEAGHFRLLRVLYIIRINGFQAEKLHLTKSQCKIFRSLFYLILTNYLRVMWVSIFVSPFLVGGIRLVYFETLSTTPKIIFALIWIVIEVTSFFILVIGVVGAGAHMVVLIPWYYFRLNSFCEIAENLNKEQKRKISIPLNLKILKIQLNQFNLSVIKFMNEFDTLSVNLKYLSLTMFVYISFICDCAIFLGPLGNRNSELVKNSFGCISILGLSALASGGYVCGGFLEKLFRLHGLYIELSSLLISNIETEINLKMLEILDRIMGPFTRVTVGDFCTLERSFVVYFTLENISTIMLLYCNLAFLL